MKTTARHFRTFRDECERCAKRWGFAGFRLEFRHGACEAGVCASCRGSATQRALFLTLSLDWPSGYPPTDANLRETARHEMRHAFIAQFSALASSRFVTPDEIDAAEHELCERLRMVLP